MYKAVFFIFSMYTLLYTLPIYGVENKYYPIESNIEINASENSVLNLDFNLSGNVLNLDLNLNNSTLNLNINSFNQKPSIDIPKEDILETNITQNEPETTSDIIKNSLFKKRFIYFDRTIANDKNFNQLKQIMKDASTLGFNGLVISEEYIFSRLSHQNETINSIKDRFSEIGDKAREYGLEIIPMHFNPSIPTLVLKDKDPYNPFYNNGEFDFSEASLANSTFKVIDDEAIINGYTQVKNINQNFNKNFDFEFSGIEFNKEYRITLTISTQNFKNDSIKVSILDNANRRADGLLYGINKYFKNIKPSEIECEHQIYFNSLNHKNFNGKIKVYLSHQGEEGIELLKIKVEEVSLILSLIPQRSDTKTIVKSNNEDIIFEQGVDYSIEEEKIKLLSSNIKKEKYLKVQWYPKIDVARLDNQETMADFCANPELYIDIIKDQYQRIIDVFGDIDAIAFNDDEWREAGFNKKCKEIFSKEYNSLNKEGGFTGGDYIGITTRRIIEDAINKVKQRQVYLMSDMFDPYFNARDPYMGVNNGAEGSWDYLPEDAIVFNWFANPKEPGLEGVPYKTMLKSFKHFSDHNIKQIIAGYHDDMKNVKTNIRVYKESKPEVQKSIVGFMFLIWNQDEKPNATYDDMPNVVKQICQELPEKWPQDVCIQLGVEAQ